MGHIVYHYYLLAGKLLYIIFIGIDKSKADSLFSYEYNEKQLIYFLGNKVECIDLDTALFNT